MAAIPPERGSPTRQTKDGVVALSIVSLRGLTMRDPARRSRHCRGNKTRRLRDRWSSGGPAEETALDNLLGAATYPDRQNRLGTQAVSLSLVADDSIARRVPVGQDRSRVGGYGWPFQAEDTDLARFLRFAPASRRYPFLRWSSAAPPVAAGICPTASIRAFDGGMFGSQGGSCDPFTQIDAGGNPAS